MNRLAAATPSAAAHEGARRLLEIFDQSKTYRRFDDEVTLPPDGVLDAREFPSARFEAIDRLELSDGRVTQSELARALDALSPAAQAEIVSEAKLARTHLESKGKRFLAAFAGFGLGGLAVAGGLALGAPVVAALGALGVLGGFGTAVHTIFSAGRVGGKLFAHVEAHLTR